MNILFVHQNFPGQFRTIAPDLIRLGHNVNALTAHDPGSRNMHGVNVHSYNSRRSVTREIHPWIAELEAKVIRGEACFNLARQLRAAGFIPDLIIAHPGWGESLYLKQVWPAAKLAIYCEMFYRLIDADFDPEFSDTSEELRCQYQMTNANNLINIDVADIGISPTLWQAATYPAHFRSKISVIHDGIDTRIACPNPGVELTLGTGLSLNRKSEVITFVSRNLEPHRGYHIFMRALPEILDRRPNAHVLIVGGDAPGYGARAPEGQTWKELFAREIRPKMSQSAWQRIHFVGKISYEHYIAVLQISTVHVYLTCPFVLSWSLLEAMSCGAAIVASDTAPVREAIEHEATGLLFPFFDTHALAQSVCRVLSDKEMRDRLGNSAREIVVEKYDLVTKCLPQQRNWVADLVRINT